jgi:RNA polymerase-binding transcription factor DksA
VTALQSAAPAVSARRSDTTLDLHAIRADLERQRRFRVEQLSDLASTVMPTGADGAHDEVASALRTAALTVLAEIEAALQRIELGCYGRCQRCGDAIPPERLEALPMAGLCMFCQYAKEAGDTGRTHQVPLRHTAPAVPVGGTMTGTVPRGRAGSNRHRMS